MGRYLAYDPALLVNLKHAADAAVWHIAATRFDHAYCEEWRASVLSIRPVLEEARDTLLQPVIDSDAMASFGLGDGLPAFIVVDGEVLDTTEEIRAFYETSVDVDADATPNDVVVAVMLTLTPVEAATYFATLTDDERIALIQKRPDLAARALDGGATPNETEFRELDRANSFAEFSETFAAAFAVDVNLRWATIRVDDEYSVVAMKMSDGTVQVAIVNTAQAGVGVEADGGDGSSASAVAGAFMTAGHVFVFPDEETAEHAVDDLQTAITDRDWGDVAEDWWDRINTPWMTNENDLEEFIDETWDEYGAESRDEGGLYAEVAAGIENDFAEAEASAGIRISVYDTDTTGLATQLARTGIIVTGTVGGHVQSASAGGSASGEASFTVDAYTNDDGEFVTVTVQGSASAGGVVDALAFTGLDAVDWDLQVEGGAEATISITVPLNGDGVRPIVSSLANGNLPEALGGLYDSADITVTVNATVETSSEVSVDAEVVETSQQLTVTQSENIVTLRKYPDGEFYSQNDLDDQIPQPPLGDVITDDDGNAIYIDTGEACLPLDN